MIKEWARPYLLHYHCVAHKLALANKHAALENAAAFLEDAVRQILTYYKNSGDRRAVLTELQKELGISELKLLKLHKIRWLSMASVVDRIFVLYPALRRHFEREGKDASHIHSIIESHKFLGYLAGSRDILCQQAVFNKICQKTDVHFKRVRQCVEQSCHELRESYIVKYEKGKQLGGSAYDKVYKAMVSATSLDRASDEAKKKADRVSAEKGKYESVSLTSVSSGMDIDAPSSETEDQDQGSGERKRAHELSLMGVRQLLLKWSGNRSS